MAETERAERAVRGHPLVPREKVVEEQLNGFLKSKHRVSTIEFVLHLAKTYLVEVEHRQKVLK